MKADTWKNEQEKGDSIYPLWFGNQVSTKCQTEANNLTFQQNKPHPKYTMLSGM
jgi:hypothetical protein